MSRYPRFLRQQHAHTDELNIQRAIGTQHHQPDTTRHTPPTAVDSQRLRGIPAIGPGVTGAIPGTTPHTLDNIR